VRFSSLGEQLYVHSSFPTDAADAVFFGPDTYRFVAAVQRRARPARIAVDLGCGSGAGGLAIAGRVERMILSDVNARALELSRVNAELADASVEFAQSDLFAALTHVGEVDLVIANPPYLVDAAARTYRDGGRMHGIELALRMVAEGLQRLRAGGQLILYSGAPFRRGVDLFRSRLAPLLEGRRLAIDYEELDPDVFGEELDEPAYRDIERIAVVCLDLRRPR
jgi:methylase of polypeptide subunit release factors